MSRVLIVEYGTRWQQILKTRFDNLGLAGLVVDLTDFYHGALAMVTPIPGSAPDYDAYVFSSHFPQYAGSDKPEGRLVEPLGIKLAQELREKGVDYSKISIVSDISEILQEAIRLGMRGYRKSKPNKIAGERHWSHIAQDLKEARLLKPSIPSRTQPTI